MIAVCFDLILSIIAQNAEYLYSRTMQVFLHRLRARGVPIPKYQFAFKDPVEGELWLREEVDPVFNRHLRVATLKPPSGVAGEPLHRLLDAQVIELTRERMILSGIEREHDLAINKIEDFAQTWVCWFERNTG